MPFRPRRLRRLSRPILFILLVSFLILSRFIPPLADFQDRFLHQTFTPILSGISNVQGHLSDFFRHYVFLTGVSRENEHLKSELTRLKDRMQELETENASLQREDRLLRSYEGFPEKKEVARVLAYDPLSATRSILIDRGSEAGVQKGQAVVVAEGAVGVVVKTTPNDSQVMLLSDPRAAVDGELTPSQARGLIRGDKKGLGLNRDYWITRMEYLGVNQEIKEEDLVVTSGLDQVFPPGIPLGRVKKVLKDEKGLFLSAEVLPEVDFSKLKEVMVLVK